MSLSTIGEDRLKMDKVHGSSFWASKTIGPCLHADPLTILGGKCKLAQLSPEALAKLQPQSVEDMVLGQKFKVIPFGNVQKWMGTTCLMIPPTIIGKNRGKTPKTDGGSKKMGKSMGSQDGYVKNITKMTKHQIIKEIHIEVRVRNLKTPT